MRTGSGVILAVRHLEGRRVVLALLDAPEHEATVRRLREVARLDRGLIVRGLRYLVDEGYCEVVLAECGGPAWRLTPDGLEAAARTRASVPW